jgi:hypothetical protein
MLAIHATSKKLKKKSLIVMKGAQFTKLFTLNWNYLIILMEIIYKKKEI